MLQGSEWKVNDPQASVVASAITDLANF